MTGESQDCQTCNKSKGKEYALRLRDREGDEIDIDITLCETCADELLDLDWIKQRVPVSQD